MNKYKIISILLALFSIYGLGSSIFMALFMTAISCDDPKANPALCYMIGGVIGLVSLFIFFILPAYYSFKFWNRD